MGSRRAYGLTAMIFFAVSIVLLAFWVYPFAIATFVIGILALRRGEQAEPT
jgi:hypothetical protein